MSQDRKENAFEGKSPNTRSIITLQPLSPDSQSQATLRKTGSMASIYQKSRKAKKPHSLKQSMDNTKRNLQLNLLSPRSDLQKRIHTSISTSTTKESHTRLPSVSLKSPNSLNYTRSIPTSPRTNAPMIWKSHEIEPFLTGVYSPKFFTTALEPHDFHFNLSDKKPSSVLVEQKMRPIV